MLQIMIIVSLVSVVGSIHKTLLAKAEVSDSATLVVISKEALEVDPKKARSDQMNPVLDLTHPPMTYFNERWQWDCYFCIELPDLAHHLTKSLSKKKSGKIQYTMAINPQVNWSDGSPLTAKDMKRGIEKARSLSKALRKVLLKIDPDKRDPRKFQVTFSSYHRHNPSALAIRIPPPNDKPHLSYGLYRLVAKTQQEIKLVKNSYTTLATPPWQEVVFRQKSPESPRLGSPKDHETLLVLPKPLPLSPVDIDSKLIPHTGVSDWLDMIVFNLRNKKFRNAALRKALSFAINRDHILQDAYEGKGFVTHSFQHPADPLCPSFSTPSSSSLKELFRKAGYALDEKNELVFESTKKRLKLKLAFQNTAHMKMIAKAIAQSLTEWGILVEFEALDPKTYREKTLAHAHFEEMLLTTWKSSPGSLPYYFFHSKESPTYANGYRGHNLSGWNNKKVDSILTDFNQENLNIETFYCEQLAAIFQSEQPVIPLLFRAQTAYASQPFKNLGHFTSLFSELLYIEKL